MPASPARRAIGAACALVVLSTRGFVVEAAAGENLLPGFAAALFLLDVAARDRVDLPRLGGALFLALIARQDNIFLLPGVIIAAGAALPTARRAARLATMLGLTAAATLGVYVLSWLGSASEESFVDYLTRFGRTAAWGTIFGVNADSVALHFAGFGAALVGRHWLAPAPHNLVGAAFVVLLAAAARLVRGTAPLGRFTAAVLVTVAIRIPFYVWFEPVNFEWQILPVVLLVALASRSARGTMLGTRRTERIGVAILILMALAIFAVHAPSTWKLRERRLETAVSEVIEQAGPDAWFVAVDKSTALALTMRGIPHERMLEPEPHEVTLRVGELLRHAPRPIAVIADRFIEDGMPFTDEHAGMWCAQFDLVPDSRTCRVLRREGKAYAAILRAP